MLHVERDVPNLRHSVCAGASEAASAWERDPRICCPYSIRQGHDGWTLHPEVGGWGPGGLRFALVVCTGGQICACSEPPMQLWCSLLGALVHGWGIVHQRRLVGRVSATGVDLPYTVCRPDDTCGHNVHGGSWWLGAWRLDGAVLRAIAGALCSMQCCTKAGAGEAAWWGCV